MQSLDKIAKYLKDATSVAIISHINPDPDTICSALALRSCLQHFNIDAHIFCETPLSGKLLKFKGIDVINKNYLPSYNVCVCLDCSDIYRLGGEIDIFQSAKITMNIDHHRTNTEYAHLNYIQGYASSTCEMLYKLVLRLDPNSLNDYIAEMLYTGMVADSGAFTFPSTSNDTMTIAGELMRFGFDASKVCYDMIKKVPKKVFNLKLRVLKTMKMFDSNAIGVITFTIKDFKLTRTSIEDTSGLINDVLNIEPVMIAIAITEVDSETFKISMRSKNNYDVADIADNFGGGGHRNASGCELHGNYDEILLRLLRECRKQLCKA